MASSTPRTACITCGEITKYRCIKCSLCICNRCSVSENNEETKGWKAGSSVGYCFDCKDIQNSENCSSAPSTSNSGTAAADEKGGKKRATSVVATPRNKTNTPTDSEESDDEKNENVTKGNKTLKKKPGRKAVWATDVVNDLVDIITSNERYQRKLIFTNTKNQNNRVIYDEVLTKLKKRATERGETITFNIQQTRSKFKRCISDCKQAAMTVKTATGIRRFQDDKGLGKWFGLLFPLVKSRDSCQPDMAVEPSSTNDPLNEEEEIAKTFEDFVPRKKIKPTKKNAVVEAVELFKQVVENDPAKEIISFMKDEAEKARQHELQLVELMLKHQSPSNNQVIPSPPCHPPAGHLTSVQGVAQQPWTGPHQYFSFKGAENSTYNMPSFNFPANGSGQDNCFLFTGQEAFQN